MREYNELQETTKDNKKERKVKLPKKLKIIAISLVVGIVFGAFGGIQIYKANTEPKVSISYITGQLKDIGELATQQLTYSATQTMEEGSIPFINKKGFTMHYNATVKAGFDAEKIKVVDSSKRVKIIFPEAQILEKTHVDPNSIKFMDEKKAIFNWQTKEDTKKAIAMAEKDFEENENTNKEELLQKAEEHAEELVHKILDPAIGTKDIIVVFR